MEKINQRKREKELQKALAIAHVTPFCLENILSCNECAFAQPSDAKSNGLVNDAETMPKVTLIVRHEAGQLKIEETEYTKVFLK